MDSMQIASRYPTIRKIFRYLCLLTALANAGGNVFILLFYRPIFALFGVPLPADLAGFTFVSGFSFTVGVLAYFVFSNPEANKNLLAIGAIGKAIYAAFTFYFYYEAELHWFYLIFGIWDAVYAVIFTFFLIYLLSDDLMPLNAGVVFPGTARPRTSRALLLVYSLTGNGRGAMGRVKQGLTKKGYTVDEKLIEPVEDLFRFPLSFGRFLRIMFRAIFRRPAAIKPLGIPDGHDYDLVVVACQTWLIGMAAPMEGVFENPANHGIIRGRDVAAVNVCRGLWRRAQAMTLRWLSEAGGTIVGARAYSNPGWEPARTFSLFIFFALGEEGRPSFLRGWFLQQQRLGDEKLSELEHFGEALAERPTPGEPALETGHISR